MSLLIFWIKEPNYSSLSGTWSDILSSNLKNLLHRSLFQKVWDLINKYWNQKGIINGSESWGDLD